jgi:hypothetical protein
LGNYWDSWLGTKSLLFSLTNKRIPGRIHLRRFVRMIDGFQFGLLTRNKDRWPAKGPYSI